MLMAREYDKDGKHKPTDDPSIGPTGEFPDGKVGPDDDGEIRMGVGVHAKSNTVILEFGVPVTWLGLPKKQAIALGKALIMKAKIGRASCRERVEISVVAGSVKKKKDTTGDRL